MPNDEPKMPTREQLLAIQRGFASITPKQSKGNLKSQIRDCKGLYEKGDSAFAIQRLNEIANIDPSETGGRLTDQKAASKLLKQYLASINPRKNGLQ